MGAGSLRELVTAQRRGASTDGYGNAGGDFAAITGATSIPAQIRPLRASEYVGDDGVQARDRFELTVRYTSTAAGIRIGDRIVDDRSGETYNVRGQPLNMDQRDRFLKIEIESGGADG